MSISKTEALHIICEKDVGLFSLIQQVISHIPEALYNSRVPIVFFESNCCYWIEKGYENKNNVWEYYFEPLLSEQGSDTIPSSVKDLIRSKFPDHIESGYHHEKHIFVTNNFGNHKAFKHTLKIPWSWEDPDVNIRKKAAIIIQKYLHPRKYIIDKSGAFYEQNMSGQYMIGLHLRSTDVTDKNEHNIHRRGSYNLKSYEQAIKQILSRNSDAKLFVATDSLSALESVKKMFPNKVVSYSSIFHNTGEVAGKGPSGWTIPAYIADSAEKAAKNGEEAVIDYLLLSQCDYLIHSGSGLARTALLTKPELKHLNIHSKKNFIKTIVSSNGGFFYLIKSLGVNFYRTLRNKD